MDPKIVELLCIDIQAKSDSLIPLLGQSENVVLASGLLRAATHLLRGPAGGSYQPQITSYQPQAYQAQPPAYQAPPAPHQLPPMENPAGMDMAQVAAMVASRLGIDPSAANPPSPVPAPGGVNLADKWAGPLPSRNGQAPRDKIYAAKPDSECPICHDLVAEHAVFKNVPIDSKGRSLVKMCDGRKVRVVANQGI